LAILVENKSL